MSGLGWLLIYASLINLVFSDIHKRHDHDAEGPECSETDKFGPDCIYTCHCSEQCDRNTGKCPGICFPPMDGPTCQRDNVALKKAAFSIGTREDNMILTEDKAVDGDRTRRLSGNSCYFSRQFEQNSKTKISETWFYVDLGRTYETHFMTFYGSDDFMYNFKMANSKIYVSNKPNDRANACYTFNNSQLVKNVPVDLACEGIGRYVTIVDNDPLVFGNIEGADMAICELEVYACLAGFHGKYCDQMCHCEFGETCNTLTGHCPGKCRKGFYGDTCTTGCFIGCRTRLCHKTSGTCTDGCGPGWAGMNCSIPCPKTNFGQDCVSTCHCLKPGCAANNGTCDTPGCQDGYKGHNCNTDVDECADLTKLVCLGDTVCINTPGSYRCVPGRGIAKAKGKSETAEAGRGGTGTTVAAVLGGIIAVAGLVALTVFCLHPKQASEASPGTEQLTANEGGAENNENNENNEVNQQSPEQAQNQV